MGLFDGFTKTPERMERKLEGMEVENEVLTKQAEIEEKKAIISQLKAQHGKDWKNILGLKDLTLQTLRTVFHSGKSLKESGAGWSGGLRSAPDLSHLRGDGSSLSHLRNPGSTGLRRL